MRNYDNSFAFNEGIYSDDLWDDYSEDDCDYDEDMMDWMMDLKMREERERAWFDE